MELNDEPVVFAMALGPVHGRTSATAGSAISRAAAIVLAGAALSACVSLPRNPYGPLPIDLTSPVSADIRSVNLKGAAYPSFLQVPSQPTDVRPISAWNRNMFAVLAERRQSEALVVVSPQILYGAEAFAQQGRAEVAPALTADEAAALTDRSVAFAATGRARATPPSPAP